MAYTFLSFFLLNTHRSTAPTETGRKEEARCGWRAQARRVLHPPPLSPTVQTQAEVTGDHLNCDTIRKENPQEEIGKKKRQKVDVADVFVHPFNTYQPRMLVTKQFPVPTDFSYYEVNGDHKHFFKARNTFFVLLNCTMGWEEWPNSFAQELVPMTSSMTSLSHSSHTWPEVVTDWSKYHQWYIYSANSAAQYLTY